MLLMAGLIGWLLVVVARGESDVSKCLADGLTKDKLLQHFNHLKNLVGVRFGSIAMAKVEWELYLERCLRTNPPSCEFSVKYSLEDLQKAPATMLAAAGLPDLFAKFPFVSETMNRLACVVDRSVIECTFHKSDECSFFTGANKTACDACVYSACDFDVKDACGAYVANMRLCRFGVATTSTKVKCDQAAELLFTMMLLRPKTTLAVQTTTPSAAVLATPLAPSLLLLLMRFLPTS